MLKKKWTRVLALCLAVVCLITSVGALSYDLNLDGKTNVWDLQLAVNGGESDTVKAATLKEALGGADELHENASGKYEIWTPLGLYQMAANASDVDNVYTLMADIDLTGYSWVPVAPFCGTFEGNNHTISNVTITTANKASNTNMGFFGMVRSTGVIKDLHLRDVSVTAVATTNYMGPVAGTNAGTITNVTATGIITDTRTAKPASDPLCYGALAGRCIQQSGATTVGSLTGGTNISVTDGAGKYTTTGLCADIKIVIAATEDVQKNGVAGWAKDYTLVSGTYSDSTYSTSLLSAEQQERRNTVASYMEDMGTIQWTPSETIYYTSKGSKTGIHSNAYIAGTTYTGIPYNHSAGSMERFMTGIQASKDSQGRYVTVTGLEDGVYVIDPATKATGFIQYMGNDCSASIGWAWATISPARITNDNGTLYGGAYAKLTRFMVPNEYNLYHYGILPVGNYQLPEGDTTTYPYGDDVRDTQSIIALNGGASGMAEYYAMARKGDALVYNYTELNLGEYDNDGGHARMVAEDPVVIRNSKGKIDLNKSYFLTHEQGDGLFDNRNSSGSYDTYNGYNVKYTSWRTDYKYTFSTLLTESGFNATTLPGCGWGYVPVTMQAFTAQTLKNAYISEYNNSASANYHPHTAPNGGWLYSNYRVISTTMTIKDSSGSQVYSKVSYTGVGESSAVYRTNCETVKLDEQFADATDGLTAGETYTYTITLLFSNGTTKDYKTDASFTYEG